MKAQITKSAMAFAVALAMIAQGQVFAQVDSPFDRIEPSEVASTTPFLTGPQTRDQISPLVPDDTAPDFQPDPFIEFTQAPQFESQQESQVPHSVMQIGMPAGPQGGAGMQGPQFGTQSEPQNGMQGGPQFEPQNGMQNGPQFGMQFGPQDGMQGGPQFEPQNEIQGGPQFGQQGEMQGGPQFGQQGGMQGGPQFGQQGGMQGPQSGMQGGPQFGQQGGMQGPQNGMQSGPQGGMQGPQSFVQVPNNNLDPNRERWVEPQVMALPPTTEFLPQLEFSGRMIPGVGMQVVATKYHGVAVRAGLEPGDIIVEIDGRRITCESEYHNALINSAIYGGGHVDLVVKNKRYRPGCSLNPEFVYRHADLPERIVTAVAAAGLVSDR